MIKKDKKNKYLKRAFLILFILVLAASSLSVYYIFDKSRLNSDMLEYFGDDTVTGGGLKFLKDTFNIKGDTMFAVEGGDGDGELESKLTKLSEAKGVTQLIWYGTVEAIEGTVNDYSQILQFLGINPDDLVSTEQFKSFLKRPSSDGKSVYIVLMLTEFSPSSREAVEFLEEIRAEFKNYPLVFAGMNATAYTILKDAFFELPLYLLFGFMAMLILMLIFFETVAEAFIMLVTLASSVLINVASAAIGGGSVVGMAASSLLQIICTLFYTVLILSGYRKDGTAAKAVKTVIPLGLAVSAVFSTFFLMEFGLGADLAVSLIKGGVISTAVSVTVAPLLISLLKNQLGSKDKRYLKPNFKVFSKTFPRGKTTAAAILAVLLVLSFAAQFKMDLSYFKLTKNAENQTVLSECGKYLENQIIIAVPVIPKEGKSQQAFVAELNACERVEKVLGAFSALKAEGEVVETLLNKTTLLSTKELKPFFRKDESGAWYTLCTVVISGSAEDGNAELINDLDSVLSEYFDDYYKFGVATSVYDISETTSKDFWIMTAVSAALVFILLTVLLKSFKKGAVSALLSLLTLFMNTYLCLIWGFEINFFVYMLISVMQTVFCVNYYYIVCKEREEGAAEAFKSVVYATVLFLAAAAALFFVTGNLIIRDMVFLLGQGGLLCCLSALGLLLPLTSKRTPKKIF